MFVPHVRIGISASFFYFNMYEIYNPAHCYYNMRQTQNHTHALCIIGFFHELFNEGTFEIFAPPFTY